MAAMVGFGFRPYDEELINDYLNIKTLGLSELVDNAINEVNIYSFDPWDLRFQSRIDTSGDSVWYFFYRLENLKMQSRKTSSGFWKKTGPTLDIKRRRGVRDKIGEKKVYVFYLRRTPSPARTEWVMHEYHTTFFPDEQRTYVICKVEFKGEGLGIPSVNGTEPSHSFSNVGDSSSSSVVIQQDHGTSGSSNCQTGQSLCPSHSSEQFGGSLISTQSHSPIVDFEGMKRYVGNLTEDEWNVLIENKERASYDVMQEDYNSYRPHQSLTGLCSDRSSTDSDDDSSSPTIHKESSVKNATTTTSGQCQTSSADNQAESVPLSKQVNDPAQEHPRPLQSEPQRTMPPQEKEEDHRMRQTEKEVKVSRKQRIVRRIWKHMTRGGWFLPSRKVVKMMNSS